jgi:pyrimidine deaminase RibD-like protein
MVEVQSLDDRHRSFAETSVQQGKLSSSESDGKPLVGVVIARGDIELGRGYRGKTGEGHHAEYGLIRQLEAQGEDLRGVTVYTTLEPCSSRNHPKVPCAQHLIDAGISEVHIGMYDPNPRIYRDGWRMFRDAGIRLKDFPRDLRAEIERDNQEFRDQFLTRTGVSGRNVCFDYKQNGGAFSIQDNGLEVTIRLTARGADSVYLYGGTPGVVAAPRYVHEFNEVDDPDATDDWKQTSVSLAVGEVGIHRTNEAHLLVKITEVLNMDRGANQWRVCLDYELRPRR